MSNSQPGVQDHTPTFRSEVVALAKNPVFAGWVQTVVLIVTLIYMKGQVREMAKQNQIAQGSKLYDLMHDYQQLAPQVNEVRRLGWRSRDTSVSADAFLRELSGVDTEAVLRSSHATSDATDRESEVAEVQHGD